MNTFDWVGWAAASFTLLAFNMRDVLLLRSVSVAASLCFITYGAATSTWPVLALHAVLLPVNLMRLLELHRARRSAAGGPGRPAGRHIPQGAGWVVAPALVLLLAQSSTPATAAQPGHADRMQARAVESFRAGRFPEAYGRFVELANLGHPPAARYALWMCEHGPSLFGKAWDCSPQEIGEWAAAAGVAPFRLEPYSPGRVLSVAGQARR